MRPSPQVMLLSSAGRMQVVGESASVNSVGVLDPVNLSSSKKQLESTSSSQSHDRKSNLILFGIKRM